MSFGRVREFFNSIKLFPVPRIATIAYEEPLEWFLKNCRGAEGDLLLHGADDTAGKGRYSFAATRPLFILSVREGLGILKTADGNLPFSASPPEVIAELDALMARLKSPPMQGFFGGGLVCLLSYEMNRYYEQGKTISKKPETHDLYCAFYPRAAVFDALEKRAFGISWDGANTGGGAGHNLSHSISPFVCDEPRGRYVEKINRVKRYIEAGDVYQVNVSRKLSASFTGNPLGLYRSLCAVNPAAYGAYINGGDFHLLSLSPELFFSVQNGFLTTRPIKGTAPRKADAAADSAEKARLAGSGKNRAENLMIVDLMRSDLGKVCVPGSVAVESLFACESLPNVHQLVSTVRGKLNPNTGLPDILRALYPGGSVTGAPKVRAMEIIAELETTPRGVYCGSVVAWGLDGGITASLLIRTLFVEGGRAVYRTGGGIVADSIPEEEYEETEYKASMLTASPGNHL